MGIFPSKPDDTSDTGNSHTKLDAKLTIVHLITCLSHHRTTVYSIAHCVESHFANFELIGHGTTCDDSTKDSKSTTYQGRGGTVTSQYEDGDGTVTSQLEDRDGTVTRHYEDRDVTVTSQYEDGDGTVTSQYEDVDGAVTSQHENSLHCHSKALQKTFKALNKCIFAVLYDTNQDSGSSVDLVYENPNEELTQHTKDQEEIIRELESDANSLRSNVAALETYNENLTRQLEDQKRNKTISIQLYYQYRGDLMSKVMDELKSMLASHMGMQRNEIQFIVCLRRGDVHPDIPLLVLCMNASRLGTDAQTAMHDLKVSANVSILIFHHKDIHALPKQSSGQVLTGPEFKELGGIFDIAFLSDKGIYPCGMNNTAVSGIVNFLKPTIEIKQYH